MTLETIDSVAFENRQFNLIEASSEYDSGWNYVGAGNDAWVYHCGDYAVHLYHNLSHRKLKKYQLLMNTASEMAKERSLEIDLPRAMNLPEGLKVPVRVNPVIGITTSIDKKLPVSISPWIQGMNLTTSKGGNGIGDFLHRTEYPAYYDRKEFIKYGWFLPGSEVWFEPLMRSHIGVNLCGVVRTALNHLLNKENITIVWENLKVTPEGIMVTDLFSCVSDEVGKRKVPDPIIGE